MQIQLKLIEGTRFGKKEWTGVLQETLISASRQCMAA
jgi:hypothetical protein